MNPPRAGAGGRRRITGLAVAFLMTGATAGCGGDRPTAGADPGGRIVIEPDVAAVAPRDFEVDVLILTGSLRDPGDRVDERPLRISVSPDGSLHATLDRNVSGWTVPPRIRTIDRPTMAVIWEQARRIGLLDASADMPPIHPPAVRAEPDELVALVTVVADGRHRAVLARVGGPQRLDAELSNFIRRLADLAWATDRPDRGVRYIPRRYDLGDDPHARYRRDASGPDAGGG
jgi:hypothetical protein